ncbi:MAG: TetR/AcrR family transcriptional regulator [Solirubrobacterales bacterium]
MTKRRSDAERNRQRLIETAVDLLTADPETNIQEIADASGVGRTTIYRNFAGREELIEAALGVVIERSQQAAGELELDPADPDATIRSLSTVHLDLAFRFGPLIRSQDGDSPTVEEAKDTDDSPTKVFLDAARELGTIRSDQPREWQQTVMRTVALTAIAEVEAGVIAKEDSYGLVAETLVAILVPADATGS